MVRRGRRGGGGNASGPSARPERAPCTCRCSTWTTSTTSTCSVSRWCPTSGRSCPTSGKRRGPGREGSRDAPHAVGNQEDDMAVTNRGSVDPATVPVAAGAGEGVVDAGGIDAVVDEVAGHAAAWAATPAAARADLLDQVLRDTMAAQDDWLRAACTAKGLEWASSEAGEELFAGIGTLVRLTRVLRDSLRQIAQDGRPAFAGPVSQAVDGRLRVRILPVTASDRVVFAQTTAEVWMQPGVTRENLDSGQAAAYADPEAHAGVSLVLAAGNVASLGPRDALSKLFVDGKVVVMKANPVK